MPMILQINVVYPKLKFRETFELIERMTVKEQLALNSWVVDERARAMPGRKLVEMLDLYHFRITVQPHGETMVSWVSAGPLEGE